GRRPGQQPRTGAGGQHDADLFRLEPARLQEPRQERRGNVEPRIHDGEQENEARERMRAGRGEHEHILERDDFSSNRHPALVVWWSMIFSRAEPLTPRPHKLAALRQLTSLMGELEKQRQRRINDGEDAAEADRSTATPPPSAPCSKPSRRSSGSSKLILRVKAAKRSG